MEFSEEFQFEDEAARSWYERMVRQVQGHAPACLRGFQSKMILPSDLVWDDRTYWEIACSCGSKTGQIIGYSLRYLKSDYEGPLTFVTPLGFQCSSCSLNIEIIDTDLHGYDGECKARFGGYGAATYRGSGKRSVFSCHECGDSQLTVIPCFQYSHFDIIEDEPELESVAQDFFDWFDCEVKCLSCGHSQSAGDYELA